MIKRNTVQRALVLEAVLRLRSHPTADEIYAEISKICPSISRATVYRNLQQLCEQGEIRRREIPGSPDRFDHLTNDHCHARCTLCGKVTDIEVEKVPDMEALVKDDHGFAISGMNLIFDGICPECRRKRND